MKLHANLQIMSLSLKSILVLGCISLIGMMVNMVFFGFVLGGVLAVIIEKSIRSKRPSRIVVTDTTNPTRMAEIVVTGDVDQLNAILDDAEQSNRIIVVTRPERDMEGMLLARVMNTLCAERYIECAIVSGEIGVELGEPSKCKVVVEDCSERFEKNIQRLVSRGWTADGSPSASKSFWGARYVQRMTIATENS